MSILKYRKDADSPWQRVWTKFPFLASQIGTESGKTVQEELNEKVDTTDVIDIAHGGTGAGNAEEARENLGAASNPNLLDNWWFGSGVINQRGETTYNTNGYTVDRWMILTGDVLTLTDNGITLKQASSTSKLSHRIDRAESKNWCGKEMTFSAIIDGALRSVTFIMPTASSGNRQLITVDLYGNMKVLIGDFNNFNNYYVSQYDLILGDTETHLISCVKLEYGPVSTLINDHAPDAAMELMKCQRYFYRPRIMGLGHGHSSGWGEGYIALPNMRTLPVRSNVRCINASTGTAVDNVQINTDDSNRFILRSSDSAFTAGTHYFFTADFSADL